MLNATISDTSATFGVKQDMNTTNCDSSFLYRIKLILGDREPYPWGKALGLGSGSVTRTFKEGQTPNAETLGVIAKVENCSIDWLLNGKGAPYIVTRFDTDHDAADYARTLINDEPNAWSAVVAQHNNERILVLTQPAQYQIKDRELNYNIVEIITPAGPQTLSTLSGPVKSVHTIELNAHAFSELKKGYMGTYKLLGWKDKQGLLAKASPASAQQMAQSATVYDFPASNPLQGAESRPELYKKIATLSQHQQQKINDLVDSMIEPKNNIEKIKAYVENRYSQLTDKQKKEIFVDLLIELEDMDDLSEEELNSAVKQIIE